MPQKSDALDKIKLHFIALFNIWESVKFDSIDDIDDSGLGISEHKKKKKKNRKKPIWESWKRNQKSGGRGVGENVEGEKGKEEDEGKRT